MVLSSSAAEAERHKDLSAKLSIMAAEQQERLAERKAKELQLKYVNLTSFPVDGDVLDFIPKDRAIADEAVLFYRHGKDSRLGALNPMSEEVARLKEELQNKLGAPPKLYVISPRSLEVCLSKYWREKPVDVVPEGEVRITQEKVLEFEQALVDLKKLGQQITSLPPTEVLNAIVVGAVKLGASDIHIEPQAKEARLRYRVDGVLQDITTFDRQGWALVLSRVKVLANLKLNVSDVPQDGSFVLRVGEDAYDMRLSVLPGGDGENIVIRILNRKAEAVTIPDLGMKKRDYDTVMAELNKTNGLILVTGPTGSGKTTTLASFLREVNKPELKIVTLEDPIEYHIPGVQQTEVDTGAGYTFASGLRSILRQDPDVIMVGEMRDIETAEIAVQAALTGHLVFSTLHTNDAPGAVPRLVDIGVKPFVLAPALNIIIAQRLVRVVCSECAEEYKPDKEIREHILEAMSGVREDIFDAKALNDPELVFLRAKGCGSCANTGYRGRQGVFEIFTVEGRMEELVLQGSDGLKIKEEAMKQGMTTIAQDAYLKVINKITTIEEVRRISDE